ncbi:hypothetical protein C8T65DRAFT_551696, partial [Cerioporus squamosus]
LLRHGAIVSGSVALHYFLPRALWEPNDIDIYVAESRFEDFIREVTDPAPDSDSQASDDSVLPSGHAGIREVRQFYTLAGRRVDIISVPSTNPVAALKQFWSSLVTNFIRPDMAACGFPLTTLDGLAILK